MQSILYIFVSFYVSGYRFNNIGSIPSVLADRIRIRKTFADSELTPYINLPCGFVSQTVGGGGNGYQHLSVSPALSPTLSPNDGDGFTGSRRLKMLAESYQSQRHEMALLSCGPTLLPAAVESREKAKSKLSFSIESILA